MARKGKKICTIDRRFSRRKSLRESKRFKGMSKTFTYSSRKLKMRAQSYVTKSIMTKTFSSNFRRQSTLITKSTCRRDSSK